MKTKKFLLIVLNLIVVLVMVVGCTTATTEAPKPTQAEAEPTQAEAEPTEAEVEPTKEPAPTEPPPAAEPVDVMWQFALATDQAVPEEREKVEQAVSQMLQAKGINVNLKLVPYDWSEFNDKLNLQFQAGEKCDIVFTAPWINNVYQHIANGDFLPLTDLLPEYAPELWQQTTPEEWRVATVKGDIYSVLNRQIWSKVWGPYCRRDLLEKYPLDWSTINKIEDMIPWMDQVLAGEPDLLSIFGGQAVWRHEIFGWDPIDDGIGGYETGLTGVEYDDPAATVFNVLDQPEFAQMLQLKRDWVLNRYLPPDVVTSDESLARWNAGQYACGFHVWKPEQWGIKGEGGYIFDGKVFEPHLMTTAGPAATMSAVCATSDHPVEAVQVLNAVNTDARIFNTIVYGIEGDHWKWVDEAANLIEFGEARHSSGGGQVGVGWGAYNWMMGNTFNGYYIDPIWAENKVWQQTDDLNKSALPSVILGFTFDREPVTTELAQVAAIAAELVPPLMNGQVEDPTAALEELRVAMEEAGLPAIIAELQRQINEYLANQ